MKTIKMFIELEYDDDWYGNIEERKDFIESLLKPEGNVWHSNHWGDDIGTIKVISMQP